MASQLSVIIVAYNSNEVLLPCLESLERYNPLQKELEVIVVDNLPVAGLEALLKAVKLFSHLSQMIIIHLQK